MNGTLLVWLICWIAIVVGDKSNRLVKGLVNDKIVINNTSDSKTVIKNELPPLSGLQLSKDVPYTFIECVADLKLIFTTLVDDMNQNTENKEEYVNQHVSLFNRSKLIKVRKNPLIQNLELGYLKYDVESFFDLVFQICSQGSDNESLLRVSTEFQQKIYNHTCTILIKESEDDDRDDECFRILEDFNQEVRNKNSFDSKQEPGNRARKTSPGGELKDKKFLKNYKIFNFKKELGKNLISSAMQGHRGKIKSKEEKEKALKLVDNKKLSLLRTTVPKILNEVSSRPSVALKKNIISQVKREAETQTGNDNNISTIWKVNEDIATPTGTVLSLGLLSSTKAVNVSINISKGITTKFDTRFVNNVTVVNMMKDTRVEGNDHVGANNFNLFSPILTRTVTTQVTVRRGILRPLGSRMCNAITLVGLRCPFRSTPTTEIASQPTDNLNINININENKGNIKVYKHTDNKNLIAISTTTTKITKTNEITKVTKTTETISTTKTKYKIETNTIIVDDNWDDDTDDHLEDYDNDNCDENFLEDYDDDIQDPSDDYDDDCDDDFVENNNLDKNVNIEYAMILKQSAKSLSIYPNRYGDNSPSRYYRRVKQSALLDNNSSEFIQYLNGTVYDSSAELPKQFKTLVSFITTLTVLLLLPNI